MYTYNSFIFPRHEKLQRGGRMLTRKRMFRRFVSVCALAVCLLVGVHAADLDGSTLAAGPTANTFGDVQPNDYYYAAVSWAVQNGITVGTTTTTFSPDQPCTRAEAVTFLWRAFGSPRVSSSANFSDVSEAAYYAPAVAWAVQQGITAGTGNGKFCPNETCSRAQIVTFLYRAADSPEIDGYSRFRDVSTGQYYSNAVQWAVACGITNGTGDAQFSPDDACTRAQVVTFLYRDITGNGVSNSYLSATEGCEIARKYFDDLKEEKGWTFQDAITGSFQIEESDGRLYYGYTLNAISANGDPGRAYATIRVDIVTGACYNLWSLY